MSKRHNEVLEHLAELAEGQKNVADNAEAMSDKSIIISELMFLTALLGDLNESLAIIADKIGGAE